MSERNHPFFIERLSGNGNLTFVLIHNAGGNHHFFSHQVNCLKKHGDVVWLDLPGHGNATQLSNYDIADFSIFINKICHKLSLNHICLIGLNNGANIVIDLALNYSLPIHSLILIDPPLFMSKEFISEIHAFINQLDYQDSSEFSSLLVQASFIQTASKNKAIAKKAFNVVDKKILQHMFANLIEWDKNIYGKLVDIEYPTLCILTNEHHCKYTTLQEQAPQFEIGKVIGSQCWATLEVPHQLNAMIERFLMMTRYHANFKSTVKTKDERSSYD